MRVCWIQVYFFCFLLFYWLHNLISSESASRIKLQKRNFVCRNSWDNTDCQILLTNLLGGWQSFSSYYSSFPFTQYGKESQSLTKGCRQIHEIKPNKYFCGMFYSCFFAIFYWKTSKFGFRVTDWVLAINYKHFKDFHEIF